MKMDTKAMDKLTQDLRDATMMAALAVMAHPEDGGTCNFDAPVMWFPRVRKDKVIIASERAKMGLYQFSGGGWHVPIPFGGQAERRTRQAEAMYRLLIARGWEVTMYYQMD